MRPNTLTVRQVDAFIRNGYLHLPGCVPRAQAQAWADRAFARLGYKADDPSTWAQSRIIMSHEIEVPIQEFAPAAWAATCDLMGGEDRVAQPYIWNDGFILTLNDGADRPWDPPSAAVAGWHKDGNFFKHFLDSPEQGLLTIFAVTDILPRGGGTFIAPDSIAVIAKFLAQRPEGVRPRGFGFPDLIKQCREFVEITAQAGDVFLLHPFMMHAASQNHRGVPRIIINPAAHLREPMQFNRSNPEDVSPVERAILRGLGVERLDFKPTAPREALFERMLDYKEGQLR